MVMNALAMNSHRNPAIQLPPIDIAASSKPPTKRSRTRSTSGSVVKVEHVGDRTEEVLDRGVYVNINADWVNAKGAWLIHVVLIVCGKVLIDSLPGMSQQLSWTLTNLFYVALSYLMFHWVTGMPFGNDMHGGAYDELTLWEQIDDGAQYTPARKWLITVPVVLFLASTHYTNYDPWLFALNLSATIFVLVPKLPQLHRQRLRLFTDDSVSQSGSATPISASFSPSGAQTPVGSRITDITAAHFNR